jgi:hypothetical protein
MAVAEFGSTCSATICLWRERKRESERTARLRSAAMPVVYIVFSLPTIQRNRCPRTGEQTVDIERRVCET